MTACMGTSLEESLAGWRGPIFRADSVPVLARDRQRQRRESIACKRKIELVPESPRVLFHSNDNFPNIRMQSSVINPLKSNTATGQEVAIGCLIDRSHDPCRVASPFPSPRLLGAGETKPLGDDEGGTAMRNLDVNCHANLLWIAK